MCFRFSHTSIHTFVLLPLDRSHKRDANLSETSMFKYRMKKLEWHSEKCNIHATAQHMRLLNLPSCHEYLEWQVDWGDFLLFSPSRPGVNIARSPTLRPWVGNLVGCCLLPIWKRFHSAGSLLVVNMYSKFVPNQIRNAWIMVTHTLKQTILITPLCFTCRCKNRFVPHWFALSGLYLHAACQVEL